MQQREEQLARKNPVEDANLTFGHGAGVAMQHGQARRSRELARQAADIASRANLKEQGATYLAISGRRQAEFGLKTDAHESEAAALAVFPGTGVKEEAAVGLAAAGEEKRAQALISELTRQRPNDQWVQAFYAPWVNATIALNHGDAAKAIELLRPATMYRPSFFTSGATYTRGRAYLIAGQPNEAAQQFQSIIAVRMAMPASSDNVLAQVGLARAYAAMGDKDKARSAYQDVLALWKDADPGVPLIEQVRAEYAKLQ